MTKSKLKAVAPEAAEPSKPKILIYGKPGVGKTWTSLDFPSVYYIDTEGGANLPHYTDKLTRAGGAYLGVEHDSVSFDTIIEQVKALATEKHTYKTIVIDSISKVFNNEIVKEGERLEDAGKKNEFGADKKPAVLMMRRLLSWLNRLDMNVILISHEKSEWGRDSKGERVEIGSTFDCWDKLEYELHLCLNITKQGNGRKARIRKTRLLGFPDGESFDWSYDEFAKRYGKDIMEKESVTIQLATPEQLEEIGRLLEIVRLDNSTKDKWIAENASTLNEIDAAKAESIISHLRNKTKGE